MRKGWTETTLGEVAERFTGKNTGNIDFVMTVSSKYGLITQEEFFTKRVASNNLGNYTVVEPGSYVFNKSYSAESPLGVIARNNYPTPGLVSPLYIVFKPIRNRIDPNFLSHACDSSIFWNSLRLSLKEGGRAHGALNIKVNDFFNTKILLPPLPEQKRIVDLISSVDSYIYALERQAKSARKSRSAVLHEMLSAGGDGWTETTLDGIADYLNGYPFKPAELGDDGVPVIRIKQLLDPMEPVDRTLAIVPEKNHLKDGDIIFSWSGTLAVRIWNRGEAYLNQHLFKVVEKKGVVRTFLPLAIEHAIDDLVAKSHGTTMKHITKQTLLPHKVLLPPLVEQKRIVDLISSMDDGISATDKLISETKKLRSGLLTDLLSGDHEIPKSYDKVMGAA